MTSMPDIENETDEGLMTRVQNAEHEAFAVLVRRHTRMFYAAAYRVCSHQDLAEDIVQEAFLKLWRNPALWDNARGAKFTTWFYRVVTNQAIDVLRKQKPTKGSDVLERIMDDKDDQQAQMEQAQEQDMLENAIQSLPERQRIALNLCFYEGLSNKDAADILGVGLKALESLLMRAKAGLKDELKRQGLLQDDNTYGKKGQSYG
tara:strand:+ start:776 stop:1387 length:612 start_codon:yes stop_codon:yes gene_type:complete